MIQILTILLCIGFVGAVDYAQPTNEMTTEAIDKYVKESWCGGVIGKHTVNGQKIIIIHMTRTSGINSSELYIYKAINIDLWTQLRHFPLIANSSRKIEIDGKAVVVTEIDRNGQQSNIQRFDIQ